ncbi:amidohydrolase family protein [uncultured Draconibacterium sp.]|uniref:amidohydrolase family protein n=1 Tax=uncultured Draconibacterium sp. TaxID=1573823 RepID=UPI0025F35B7B|nr:amidohydrolase family protein [uncultured Draconibacterium sp.]
MKIDAHQHFWKYNPEEYSWITDELMVIKRDFLPQHLQPLLKANGYDSCIAVQARQTIEETNWLLGLANQNSFIKGVVGWVDLRSNILEQTLEELAENKKLVGVRHVVQDEPDNDFMLRQDFKNGIALLEKFSLTYDILVFPKQLSAAIELAKTFPNQPFVIDHIAKPDIKSGRTEEWKKNIRPFKDLDNVKCKISGMVTEADWANWSSSDFTPYLDVIVETFGTKRIMYGSDWPVCLLAADYAKMSKITKEYFAAFSQTEQDDIYGKNCERFYLNR